MVSIIEGFHCTCLYVYCWPRNFFIFGGGGGRMERETGQGEISQGSPPPNPPLYCGIDCRWHNMSTLVCFWVCYTSMTMVYYKLPLKMCCLDSRFWEYLGVCLNGWFGMFYDECTFKGCLFEGNPLHGPLTLPFLFLYVPLPFFPLPSPPFLTSPFCHLFSSPPPSSPDMFSEATNPVQFIPFL